MPELRAIIEGSATQTIAETLKVAERVLITPHTSISIANIATLSVVPIVQKKKSVALPIIAIFFITLLIYVQMEAVPYAYQSADQKKMLVALSALIVAGLLLYHFARPGEQWRLLIGTSDGGRNYFTAPQRETLDKVRDLLTEKINGRDETAVYNINFQTGDVQIAERGATAGAFANGRMGASEIVYPPGAQNGAGHPVNGAGNRVDYSANLPAVAQWAEHFRNSEHRELAERLDELERLMRSGTPTLNSRIRVRELSDQVTRLMAGASEAVNLFGSVARAAGYAVV